MCVIPAHVNFGLLTDWLFQYEAVILTANLEFFEEEYCRLISLRAFFMFEEIFAIARIQSLTLAYPDRREAEQTLDITRIFIISTCVGIKCLNKQLQETRGET